MQSAAPPGAAATATATATAASFSFRDGASNNESEHHDGMILELEPAYTPQDEQKELATLSIPDIINIESDLRGITADISDLRVDNSTGKGGMDTPETVVIPSALSRLDEEMSRLPTEVVAAYRHATVECPDQVSDERKMAFLEHENGDAVLAANRLAKYWEIRLHLFGPERCFLPMTLDGAMKDETENLISRRVNQVIPVRDTAGRAILYIVPSRRNFEEYSVEQDIMAFMYLMETVIEDADLRRRGFVFLVDERNVQRKHYSPKIKHFAAIMESVMPIRSRAIHMCFPSKLFYYVIHPVVKHFLPRDMRLRMKLHYGSTDQVLRDLESYCLPRDRLPRELGGDIILNMNKWVTERLALERANIRPGPHISTQTVECPAPKRMRSENDPEMSGKPAPLASATDEKEGNDTGRDMGKTRGRKSDLRMTRAIEAKLADNDLSLYDALIAGGFVFKEDRRLMDMVDADGITLTQRKNNLCRRLRRKKQKSVEQDDNGSTAARKVAEEQDGVAISTSAVSDGMGSPLQALSCHVGGVDVAQQSTLTLEGNNLTKLAATRSTNVNHDGPNTNVDGVGKRDSFYESILELPGLDDVDGLDFMDEYLDDGDT